MLVDHHPHPIGGSPSAIPIWDGCLLQVRHSKTHPLAFQPGGGRVDASHLRHPDVQRGVGRGGATAGGSPAVCERTETSGDDNHHRIAERQRKPSCRGAGLTGLTFWAEQLGAATHCMPLLDQESPSSCRVTAHSTDGRMSAVYIASFGLSQR